MVCERVKNPLPYPPPCPDDGFEFGWRFDNHPNTFLGCCKAHSLDRFGAYFAWVAPFEVGLDLFRAHARQVHHIADQGAQVDHAQDAALYHAFLLWVELPSEATQHRL